MHLPKIKVLILTGIFIVCAFFVYGVDKDSETPITRSLHQFPQTFGVWQTVSTQSMSEKVENVLGVDDYVLRNYRNSQGTQINVYISYFTYIDRNKGYHSPLNCMPGSGWNIAETDPVLLELSEAGRETTVNRLVMQNGSRKMVSLYWYQCRGRILHNEYVERIYRVLDSIFMNRTDGAFIRLLAVNSDQGMQEDTDMLKDFAARIIPKLREHLPE